MPLDPLTIIAAVVAIIVFVKLRSIMGQRTGLEKPPSNPFVDRRQAPPTGRVPPTSGKVIDATASPVVQLPGAPAQPAPEARRGPGRWKPFADPRADVVAGLDAVVAADPSFAPGPFLEGAKIAYEAVITAFAAGERKALQGLLAKDVYDSFAAALADRERRRETLTTTFVSMDEATIESAALEGRTARIGVRFESKQISATHGPDGALTDGSPDHVIDMRDIWTFAREVTSRDPNWKLVATQSGH